MAKKEFKIGQVFQFGNVKLKVVKSKESFQCQGCFFHESKDVYCIVQYVWDATGDCNPGKRKDKTPVKFVKVED